MTKVQIDQEGLRKLYPECFKDNPMLGEQSVDQIRDKKLYNLANQLFNLYSSKGREAAMNWLLVSTTKDDRKDAKPYIKMIFEKHGYKLGEENVSV